MLEALPHPAFGCLWDIGHTLHVGGEKPAGTLAAIGARTGYVHVKDARDEPQHPQAMSDGGRYVTPGTGQLPLAECIAVLRQSGYAGYFLFEHEKRWIPTLPEPEEIVPQFVHWFRSLP